MGVFSRILGRAKDIGKVVLGDIKSTASDVRGLFSGVGSFFGNLPSNISSTIGDIGPKREIDVTPTVDPSILIKRAEETKKQLEQGGATNVNVTPTGFQQFDQPIGPQPAPAPAPTGTQQFSQPIGPLRENAFSTTTPPGSGVFQGGIVFRDPNILPSPQAPSGTQGQFAQPFSLAGGSFNPFRTGTQGISGGASLLPGSITSTGRSVGTTNDIFSLIPTEEEERERRAKATVRATSTPSGTQSLLNRLLGIQTATATSPFLGPGGAPEQPQIDKPLFDISDLDPVKSSQAGLQVRGGNLSNIQQGALGNFITTSGQKFTPDSFGIGGRIGTIPGTRFADALSGQITTPLLDPTDTAENAGEKINNSIAEEFNRINIEKEESINNSIRAASDLTIQELSNRFGIPVEDIANGRIALTPTQQEEFNKAFNNNIDNLISASGEPFFKEDFLADINEDIRAKEAEIVASNIVNADTFRGLETRIAKEEGLPEARAKARQTAESINVILNKFEQAKDETRRDTDISKAFGLKRLRFLDDLQIRQLSGLQNQLRIENDIINEINGNVNSRYNEELKIIGFQVGETNRIRKELKALKTEKKAIKKGINDSFFKLAEDFPTLFSKMTKGQINDFIQGNITPEVISIFQNNASSAFNLDNALTFSKIDQNGNWILSSIDKDTLEQRNFVLGSGFPVSDPSSNLKPDEETAPDPVTGLNRDLTVLRDSGGMPVKIIDNGIAGELSESELAGIARRWMDSARGILTTDEMVEQLRTAGIKIDEGKDASLAARELYKFADDAGRGTFRNKKEGEATRFSDHFRGETEAKGVILDNTGEAQPTGTAGGNRPTRNNNPLNIKVGGATQKFIDQGLATLDPDPATDGGQFLVFNDVETGFRAAADLLLNSGIYTNLNIEQAMRKWSNGGYGAEVAPTIDSNRTIDSLNEEEVILLLASMAQREGFSAVPGVSGQQGGDQIEDIDAGINEVITKYPVGSTFTIQETGEKITINNREDLISIIQQLYPERTIDQIAAMVYGLIPDQPQEQSVGRTISETPSSGKFSIDPQTGQFRPF